MRSPPAMPGCRNCSMLLNVLHCIWVTGASGTAQELFVVAIVEGRCYTNRSGRLVYKMCWIQEALPAGAQQG